jgi:hypothetical protein
MQATTLIAKLVVTPLLIAGATLAGRRWGRTVGGWLVGLPLTSGPVALFLVLEHGPRFGAVAAIATMLGCVSQAAFAVTYARTAGAGPVKALGAATVAFVGATILLDLVPQPMPLALAVAVAGLIGSLLLLPAGGEQAVTPSPPGWDLPARMAVATAFVVVLTGVSAQLGARLTGLLAPYPLYAAVLAMFAHHAGGPAAGIDVLRGLLAGLFGFVAFFASLAELLVPAGPLVAFAAALGTNIVVQVLALAVMRERS